MGTIATVRATGPAAGWPSFPHSTRVCPQDVSLLSGRGKEHILWKYAFPGEFVALHKQDLILRSEASGWQFLGEANSKKTEKRVKSDFIHETK